MNNAIHRHLKSATIPTLSTRYWAGFRVFVFLGWCCLTSPGYAVTKHDDQAWLNLTSVGELYSDGAAFNRLLLWLEGQARYGNHTSSLSQQLIRVGIGHRFTEHSSLWLGYAWINTRQPFTQFPFDENRFWQQWLWSRPYTHFRLLARVRTEQRFSNRYDKTAYRVRGLLKTMVPFTPRWSVVASNEVFWHKNNFIGKSGAGFDQNRAFIGLGYNITPIVITEIGYMNQAIRRIGVPNFVGNILSLNLYVNW